MRELDYTVLVTILVSLAFTIGIYFERKNK
jgi:uncharacterized membrane protein